GCFATGQVTISQIKGVFMNMKMKAAQVGKPGGDFELVETNRCTAVRRASALCSPWAHETSPRRRLARASERRTVSRVDFVHGEYLWKIFRQKMLFFLADCLGDKEYKENGR